MQLRIGSRSVFKYLILLLFLSSNAHGAEAFPAKPIRILVAAAPGGGNDTIARVIGARLAESTGQQVIIDNRPSGNGVIAGEMLVRAPADGYTMLVVATAFTAAPGLMKKLPYDTLKDFAPITRVGMVPAALIVHSSLPVKTAKDFLALAKSKPGEITFGSAGVGTGSHLGGELFNLLKGTKLLHVPYKGSSIVTTALLSGEVMVAFTNPLSSMPHVKSGRLRNLGMAHPERWPLMPEYPTLTEMGRCGTASSRRRARRPPSSRACIPRFLQPRRIPRPSRRSPPTAHAPCLRAAKNSPPSSEWKWSAG